MFCPDCGSILLPKEKSKKKILACTSCKFTKGLEGEIIEIKENITEGKKVEVMEKENDHLPKVRSECKRCHNDVAFYWTRQTRSADEPETRFFKCTNVKCNHTWREYS